MSLREDLEEKLARFEELERQLVDPDVLANPARVTAVAREHGSLAKLATKYRRFKKLNAQIREALEMIDGRRRRDARTGRGRDCPSSRPSAKRSGTSCWT